jgi:AAA15 family ATPase/GTPase
MILRATFENILSFKQETQINFVAGKGSLHPHHVVKAEKRDDISVLRSSIVYGANAAGKSNFIKAISFIQKLALGKSPIPAMETFKSAKDRKNISKIELEIKVEKRYFAYGVEFNLKGIVEEWLYEINSRTDRKIYTRKVSEAGNEFEFGDIDGNKDTKLFIRFLGESTPKDRTFISEYVKRNGRGMEDVRMVHTWFARNLKIIFPNTRYKGLSVKVEQDTDFHKAFNSLLTHFNTGITDIRRVLIKSKEDTGLPDKVLERVEKNCNYGESVMLASSSDNEVFFFERKEDGSFEIYKQIAVHGTGDSETKFAMGEESDGTIRLLDFIPMLIDLGRNPVVYLIDELDRSMHPMMTYEIIRTFHDIINPKDESQIIFSTHESNILDLELMRADEIWFVEKDVDGSSRFYSLAEYKPRADVRKGYLQGRYGAVPFFALPETLKWNKI